MMLVLFMAVGCANHNKSSSSFYDVNEQNVEYNLPDRTVDKISRSLKRQLSVESADVYFEIFLISMGENETLMSYAFARHAGKYQGLATVGKVGEKYTNVASISPKLEWKSIEKLLFSQEILEIEDDISRNIFPETVDGTAVFLRHYKDGEEIKRVFFYSPWERRHAQERLIANAVSYFFDNIHLQ